VQKPSPSVAPTSTPIPHGSVGSDSQGGPLLAWLTLVFIALSAVATVYIARFNRRLVDVTKDMEKATSEAAEAAKQSAQAAEASLHTDRPFLLVTTIKTKVSDLGEFENKNLYGLYRFAQFRKWTSGHNGLHCSSRSVRSANVSPPGRSRLYACTGCTVRGRTGFGQRPP
jgi:hypothetical protein